MFERLKALYEKGSLNNTGIANAVVRGWITADQYQEITGEVYAG